MENMKPHTNVIIYQSSSGAIELKGDINKETIWATQAQMAKIFSVNTQAITKHLKNIYKENELSREATCSKMEQVHLEGQRYVKRNVDIYNLDAIISVGYRINSKTGTLFRQWATKTIRSYIINGYLINKKRISKNYDSFLKAVEEIKNILPSKNKIDINDVLELIKMFATTWFSLNAYDKSAFPQSGLSRKQIKITSAELSDALEDLRKELILKNEACQLFGKEHTPKSIAGIVGNIFQSFGGKPLYKTIEEKAAHLLYFIVKNHPFIDGNKRSGAFAFVWFLRKAGLLDTTRITPEALTALTLLIAESDKKDKDRLIGLILLILGK